jgi:hypothetical protein
MEDPDNIGGKIASGLGCLGLAIGGGLALLAWALFTIARVMDGGSYYP